MDTPTSNESARHYLWFDRYHRLLHGVLMFSFLGLAFTGLPLRFSEARSRSSVPAAS